MIIPQAFEENKAFVAEAFARGEFDHLDMVTAMNESDFFRMLLDQEILDRLANEYPTPRKKEEVPLWLYLASEVTLRLHGAMGFGAYPYVLHCGGLVNALGPRQVETKEDPDSGELCLVMKGYNHKNQYARKTPCDSDYLRKMARDTEPTALEHWFGTTVVKEYKRLNAFDAEGIFLVDGTYLFVPLENERYENASRLQFDENGHPVGKEEYDRMSRKQQQRCQWRRCYRAVTLSHTTREKQFSLRCGTTVLPGKAAEVTQIWPLAKRFVDAVGRGVMKLLIFDRGLIDGKTVSKLKGEGIDSLFPLKSGMDLWTDAKALAKSENLPSQRYDIPQPLSPTPSPNRPQTVARREEERQRTIQKKRQQKAQTEDQSPKRKLQWIEYTWIEPSQVWESCSVPVAVILVVNHYENGETSEWALASTRTFDDPLQMWILYKHRDQVEEDHRQEKLFWDLTSFRTPTFSLVVNRIIFVELAYSLIQIFLRKVEKNELVGRSRQRVLDALMPQQSNIALYYQDRFGLFDLYEYAELLLRLSEGVRRKYIGKMRQLRRARLTPPKLPWRPSELCPTPG